MIRHLFRPTDAAIIIYFRFFAGIFLSIELINRLSLGDFNELTQPLFHFSYLYFPDIRPWPKWGMALHFIFTILAGFAVAVGFKQRLSAIVLFLGYTGLFLMEMSDYVNHHYLYCLISFWLIWLPQAQKGKLYVPNWYYYLLLFHISVVYFFAGVAKLNPDWFSGNTVDHFIINGRKDIFRREYFKWLFTYGGLFFDLSIVPLLLWKKTRVFAFLAACLFHLTNIFLFGLATFPWFALMMTTLYFGASWPRKIAWFDHFFPENGHSKEIKWPHRILAYGLAAYCLLHLFLPLRHYLYPGNPQWTEDGHMFSWRMKLRDKVGTTFFYVVDEKGITQVISPKDYLTENQYRNMAGKPDSILQFAHFLKKKFGKVKVHASSRVSLNGKPKQEMIDIQVDLAREERGMGPYRWVLPQVEGSVGNVQR